MTNNPIIFACCDNGYAEKFLYSFLGSALEVWNHNIVIDINSPSNKTLTTIDLIEKKCLNVKFLTDRNNFGYDDTWDEKTYYACKRWLIVPDLLKQFDKIWIVDIDMIILQSFPNIEQSLGYSMSGKPINPKHSQQRQKGTIIKGDLIYCNKYFYPHAESIKNKLLKSNKRWFIDQIVLKEEFDLVQDYILFNRSASSLEKLKDFNSFAISPGGKMKSKESWLKLKEDYKTKFIKFLSS